MKPSPTLLAEIPQASPGAAYLAQKPEIDDAIRRALAGGWYILGKEVAAFEEEFSAWCGAAHGIGVANGTDALVLALRAADVGTGCAVATPAHTATATLAAIELAGALPILVDVDAYYTLDPTGLAQAAAIGAERGLRLGAVVAVHLYGQPVDLDAVSTFADKTGAVVVEDCAQAHGATWKGRRVGSIGRVGAFSLYPTKNLGALGDGGMIVTSDAALAARIGRLRQYGWDGERLAQEPGFNSRLDEVQAAVLRVKLAALDANTKRRQSIAAAYDAAFKGLPIETPRVRANATHVYHQYVIQTPERDRLRAALQGAGVGTAVHYAPPNHVHPAYAGRLPLVGGALTNTDFACARILSLPMYPEMSDSQVSRVIEAVVGALR